MNRSHPIRFLPGPSARKVLPTMARFFGRTNVPLLTIRLFALSVFMYVAFSGHYPPLWAQRSKQLEVGLVPVITTEDALQDDHIKGINDQIRDVNDKMGKQFVRLNTLESTVAGMEGEERGIGAILGLLSGVQIILQVRKKREA